MQLYCLPCGPIEANCYIIKDEASASCVVIDPGDTRAVDRRLRELSAVPSHILLTHGHFDHCWGAAGLKEIYGCPILMNGGDTELTDGSCPYFSAGQMTMKTFSPDGSLEGGSAFDTGWLKLEIMHTPGHSKGSVSLVCSAMQCVFSGDTLFFESVGRTDLHGGSMKALAESVFSKLFSLPDVYTVYPGHAEQTTVAHEKEFNPLNAYRDHSWLSFEE